VDRRRVHVEIEPNCDAVFNALLEPAQRRIGEIFDSFGEEERRVLFEFFARAAPALCEEAEHTRSGNRPAAPVAFPHTPATLVSRSTPAGPATPATPAAPAIPAAPAASGAPGVSVTPGVPAAPVSAAASVPAATPADLISPLGSVAPRPTSDQP
jgi:hypothetical protein